MPSTSAWTMPSGADALDEADAGTVGQAKYARQLVSPRIGRAPHRRPSDAARLPSLSASAPEHYTTQRKPRHTAQRSAALPQLSTVVAAGMRLVSTFSHDELVTA